MKRSAFLRIVVLAPWGLRYALADAAASAAGPRSRGIGWLLAHQSPDGSWRSARYGAFRDGRALTPLVLRALSSCEGNENACKRACDWLLAQGSSLFEEYPVHLASEILGSLPRCPVLQPLAEVARTRLLSLQCPRTGGWSYAHTPPPAEGELSPMHQANLAATTMAVEGLRAAGLKAEDAAIRRALPFVGSCQNQATGERAFDDGGFFEMPDDPARNKAGSAGVDGRGTTRYRSYSSATADGLGAMLLCGEDPRSERVVAAVEWLKRFRWRVEGGKDAPADLSYYTARSIARCGVLCPGVVEMAGGLPKLLAEAQERDGSWCNTAGEMREDCPVVATALALGAV